MQNKLLAMIREYQMVQPGDTVVCAVSGGADSMALLQAMYELRENLQIQVQAAHFNHQLRGEESLRDQEFVRAFCEKYGIVCHFGTAAVKTGEKGLEAAARTARYGFLQSLAGKIATAHTADDNAETMLMHLIRGTGLKGLGAIAPVRENIIRPMLTVTRQEVLAFLDSRKVDYVDDSSNAGDDFLRNRIRHHVMPLLKEENPSLAGNLSATALRLRQDAGVLDDLAEETDDIQVLRQMPPAVQARAMAKLLIRFGVKEPEANHLTLLRGIIDSQNPSAYGAFPGAVIGRQYDRLVKLEAQLPLGEYELQNPGQTLIPEAGIRVICSREPDAEGYPVRTEGRLVLRCRKTGDTIKLSGGTKSLKKLMIDRKIPASRRDRIPVIADDAGVVAIMDIGPNLERLDAPDCTIRFETL